MRKILREELRGYFIGEDGRDRDKSVLVTATESVSEGVTECVVSIAVEKSQEESVAVAEGFKGIA